MTGEKRTPSIRTQAPTIALRICAIALTTSICATLFWQGVEHGYIHNLLLFGWLFAPAGCIGGSVWLGWSFAAIRHAYLSTIFLAVSVFVGLAVGQSYCLNWPFGGTINTTGSIVVVVTLALLSLVTFVTAAAARRRRSRGPGSRRCIWCDYTLKVGVSEACPECGFVTANGKTPNQTESPP